MRKTFEQHYQKSKDEFTVLWRSALFAVDANVLLDAFRLSKESVRQLLNTLGELGNRLWVPHQAAAEYHNNMVTVLYGQAKSYQEVCKSLDGLKKEFGAIRKHPFLSEPLLSDFDSLHERIIEEFGKKERDLLGQMRGNPIQERVAEIFEGKVGPAYEKETLETLYQKAEERYASKIPPGYRDKQKDDDNGNSKRRYGDFILWRQLIDKAKEANKPIILVSSDCKDDWYHEVKGETLGPRPELIEEFRAETKQSFHLYASAPFLTYASQQLDINTDPKAIEEMRVLQERQRELRAARIERRRHMEAMERGAMKRGAMKREAQRALHNQEPESWLRAMLEDLEPESRLAMLEDLEPESRLAMLKTMEPESLLAMLETMEPESRLAMLEAMGPESRLASLKTRMKREAEMARMEREPRWKPGSKK